MARSRTIQHPGYEFYETESTLPSFYVQKSEALAVGFFSKGPIGVPVRVSNVSEMAFYFGAPENEQEYYVYRGVSNVLNRGRAVTILRLPYDNTISRIHDIDPVTKSSYDVYYKVLKYKFGVAYDSTSKYQDIRNAYEDSVFFKTITQTPDLVNQNDYVLYRSGQFEDCDFIISNKFHHYLNSDNQEIIVSVYGVGNAVRNQGLTTIENSSDKINYFPLDLNGTSEIYNTDLDGLKYSRPQILWQTNGDIDENGNSLTVMDSFHDENVNYFSQIPTYEKELEKTIVGIPKRVIEFYTDLEPELSQGSVMYLKDSMESFGTDVKISYDLVNASGTNISNDRSENPDKYPEMMNLENAYIEVIKVPDPEEYSDKDFYKRQVEYRIVFKNPEDELITASYKISRVVSYDINYPNRWKIVIPSEYDKDSGYHYFIDRKRANNILVVVSLITNSNLESGKYTTKTLESFCGSIFKEDFDPITGESNYIGDIINNASRYITFFGKKNYKNYNYETDSILVEGLEPYRFSIVADSKIRPDSDEKFNLEKIIKSKDHAGVEYQKILSEILSKVRNNISYTYRDVYDFGLTSVLTYMKPYTNGDYYYLPSIASMGEISGANFILSGEWKRYVKIFSNHCKKGNKLSMFHADGPRKLVLNGDMSRVDDLMQSPLDVVFTNAKVNSLMIRDDTYVETNVQWYECYDEFTTRKIWLPSSVMLAKNITYSDIVNNVWNAPAGHKYGVVTETYRPAFNPDYDLRDRLYLANLNYGISWPDGKVTIEGQKTGCSEKSALNRINVRRLMIWLERFVQNVSVRYRYTENNQTTRDSLLNALDSEFSRIKSSGGLYNYRLVCNEENNPESVIDNNELRVTIMVQPVRTVEFILANFIIAKTTASLEEIMVS